MLHSISASSLAIVPTAQGDLPPHPQQERLVSYAFFLDKSLAAQWADRGLRGMPVRAQILSGTFQAPIPAVPPKPFSGKRQELIDLVKDRVQTIYDEFDFSGFPPYLKLFSQLEEGKTFHEVELDSYNEKQGTTCVGIAQNILELLRSEGVEGSLVGVNRASQPAFDHGAAIVECNDGFLLFDATIDRIPRIYSIPFKSVTRDGMFSIVSEGPGSSTPLRFTDSRQTLVYNTHIANLNDLIMKTFVMGNLDEFIPAAFYHTDGSAIRSLKICPLEEKVVLIDHQMENIDNLKAEVAFAQTQTSQPALERAKAALAKAEAQLKKGAKKVQTFSFDAIRRGELLPILEKFMEPRYGRKPAAFLMPPAAMHEEVVALVERDDQLKELFTRVD